MVRTDREMQAFMQRVVTEPQDGWVIACLNPDGVTEAMIGSRDGVSETRQEIAIRILLADLAQQSADQFGTTPEELIARGLDYLDDEDHMVRDLVENGDLPEHLHPDADGSDSDDEDGDGDDGAANIPIQ